MATIFFIRVQSSNVENLYQHFVHIILKLKIYKMFNLYSNGWIFKTMFLTTSYK